MDEYGQLRSLMDLAESVGITIRRAPAGSGSPSGAGELGEHPGGALVRLRGKEILFLDPTASVVDRIAVVAAALAGKEEIENTYLPPEIRQLIEQAQGVGRDGTSWSPGDPAAKIRLRRVCRDFASLRPGLQAAAYRIWLITNRICSRQ